MKEFLRVFVFLSSPASVVAGMTLLGFKASQGDIGGTILSVLLIIYGYIGAFLVGAWSGKAEAVRERQQEEQ